MPLSITQLIKAFGEEYTFLKEAYESGKSVTEALEALRTGGMGIATSNAETIYNYLSGPLHAGREYINSLSLNALPNVSRLAPSATETLRNFSYILQINGTDTTTGETVQRHVTVSTNKLLTLQEAMDTAAGIVESGGAYGISEIDTVDVVDVLQNSAGIN